MTYLPALVTTEPVEDGALDMAASPRGRQVRLSGSTLPPTRRSSTLPPLSVTTASSLRPARLRVATAHDTGASSSAPSISDVAEAGVHPLLCQLLRDAAPLALAGALEDSSAAAVASPSSTSTVAEAVEALGGPDAVEALFVQLRDIACAVESGKGDVEGEGAGSAGHGGDAVFAAAVTARVRAAFNVTAVSLDAAATQEGAEDAASVQIAIPLDGAGSAAARSQHRRGDASATAPTAARSRHYLVLNVARHRGVLALHIVDLRLPEEPAHRWYHAPPTASLSRRLGQSAKSAGGEAPSTTPPPSRQSRSRSQRGAATAAATGAAVATAPAALASMQVDISPRALLTAAELNTATDSPQPAQSRRETGKRRRGHARRTSATETVSLEQQLGRGRGEGGAAVPFDPFRPEATTPFNEKRRPVTYNAAIAFQTYT